MYQCSVKVWTEIGSRKLGETWTQKSTSSYPSFLVRSPRLMRVQTHPDQHCHLLLGHSDCFTSIVMSKTQNKRSSMFRRTESSERLHAQDVKLCLIIVVWKTSNFRQEIRQSHYRNDPVKYDLVVSQCQRVLPPACFQTNSLRKSLIAEPLSFSHANGSWELIQHGYLELSHVKTMTNPDLVIANCQDDPVVLHSVGANHHLVLVC